MKRTLNIISILLFAILLSGCSSEGKAASPEVTEGPVLPTLSAVEVVSSETAAAPQVEAATEIPAAATTAPPPVEIVHLNIPGTPKYDYQQRIDDCSTGERVAMGVTTLVGAGCDNWNRYKIERPLASLNKEYLPAVDILTSYMGTDGIWTYGKIQLFKTAAGNLPEDLTVGFEIDFDVDSIGEFLLIATNLSSTEWTTDGVQVWRDFTGDVAGDMAMEVDDKPGDGYETLLFDSGLGDDPDMAWVRIDPTNGSVIEFAFKPVLYDNGSLFAWWAWSAQGTLDPTKMEIIDSMQSLETWKIDNTCGWIFGARPSKSLSNLCEYFVPTATPTATPVPSRSNSNSGPCQEPNYPGYCSTLGPGWVWYEPWCECTLFN